MMSAEDFNRLYSRMQASAVACYSSAQNARILAERIARGK